MFLFPVCCSHDIVPRLFSQLSGWYLFGCVRLTRWAVYGRSPNPVLLVVGVSIWRRDLCPSCDGDAVNGHHSFRVCYWGGAHLPGLCLMLQPSWWALFCSSLHLLLQPSWWAPVCMSLHVALVSRGVLPLLFCYVAFPVCHEYCCQWQGHDEADESQQRAPDGE